MGAEVVNRVRRTKIFGSTETVKRYEGNPRVQVHGPGFSKVLLGDDVVDHLVANNKAVRIGDWVILAMVPSDASSR